MVFPLLLAMAGAGIAAGVGKSYLDEMMAGDSREATARRYREALEAARIVSGGVGEMGPEMPTVSYDPIIVGEHLLSAGDPAGMNMILQAQQGRAGAAAESAQSEQEAAQRMALEQYKQQQLNQRAARDHAFQAALSQSKMQQGMMPQFAPMYSPEWNALSDEAIGLNYGSEILRDFQASLSQYGTETWSATAGRLGAQRAQLMNMLRLQLKTGTIDEGTLQLFDTMLPDPTKWTGDLTGSESGRLEAATEQFNMLIKQHQARRGAAAGLPEVGYITTRNLAPEGTVPVYEIGPGRANPTREARELQQLERELREYLGKEVEVPLDPSWQRRMMLP